jgi:hypothetical protein
VPPVLEIGKGENMEDTTRVSPHILRRPIGEDRETVATVDVDGSRALLVFADGESAGEFVGRTPGQFFDCQPTAVDLEGLSGVCARHGLGLCALFSFVEPGDLSVVSVEALPMILEAAK